MLMQLRGHVVWVDPEFGLCDEEVDAARALLLRGIERCRDARGQEGGGGDVSDGGGGGGGAVSPRREEEALKGDGDGTSSISSNDEDDDGFGPISRWPRDQGS